MKRISEHLDRLPPWSILLIFILTAFVIRIFTYFPSVINHDESTYIVIAQALINGDIYWVDVIDTKPVGIFLLFSFFELLFGYHFLPIRIIAAVWIGLTAFMIYKCIPILGGNIKAARSGGFIYIFITSFFTFFGLSPNTEMFFVLFTLIGLYAILKMKNLPALFLAGMAVGFGYLIKPVVFFDILALIVLIFILNKKAWQNAIGGSFIFGVGTLVPLAIVAIYYQSIGHWNTFLFYTFEVSQNYLLDKSFLSSAIFTIDFFARFFLVSIWFFVVLLNKNILARKFRLFIIIWSILIWMAIWLPGKNFSHYTIQFMTLFSLTAGFLFQNDWSENRFLGWKLWKIIGPTFYILLLATTLVVQKKDFIDVVDQPKLLVEYFDGKLLQDDLIYTGNTQHILYALLDKPSPTPYVHRGLIWTPSHQQALGIDERVELDHIYNNPKVKFALSISSSEKSSPHPSFQYETTVHQVDIFIRK